MKFDDAKIDAVIWQYIEQSANPYDFSDYIAQRLIGAGHLEAAERNTLIGLRQPNCQSRPATA